MTVVSTVSSRMSISGRVRLTHTSTELAFSRTVYVVLTNATVNGSVHKVFETGKKKNINRAYHHHHLCRLW